LKPYQHLAKEERFYIHQAVREDKSRKAIAMRLGRHPSTITREMKRNMWPSATLYTYEWALYFTRLRKHFKATQCHRKLTPDVEIWIVALLKQN